MPRLRTGTLRWSPIKKTWTARIPYFEVVEGGRVRIKRTVDLGTADRALAREKLKREVARSLKGETPTAEQARAAVTVAEYSARWLDRRDALGIAAAGYERRYLDRVWLPALGALPLDKVSKADVQDVLDAAATGKVRPKPRRNREGNEVPGKPYSRQSIAHMRATIVRLLQAAWKDELVAENKAARTDVPEVEQDGKARAVLTDAEVRQLLSHPRVDAEMKLLLLISRTVGGLRSGDLNALDWQAFTPNFETCTFVRRKTRKKRPRPETHVVPDEVRPFIEAWWDRHKRPTTGPVFPVRRGKRAGEAKKRSNMSYADRLRRELLVAGVTRHELHHETPTTRPVDFHSTRRAYATAIIRTGASDRETMKLGGWSSPDLVTRYDEKQAIRVLPTDAVPSLDRDWTKLLANRSRPRKAATGNPGDSGAGHEARTRDPELGKQRRSRKPREIGQSHEQRRSGRYPVFRGFVLPALIQRADSFSLHVCEQAVG